MKITGIICEYNPFHLGHQKQIDLIRKENPDSGIVCLMSGNFVQRGAPAIFDTQARAKAALLCGADLVLELPVTAALSSAEGFAAEGVRILSSFCHDLSFGAETARLDTLIQISQALLDPEFAVQLKAILAEGLSFPAARQKALEKMGIDGAALNMPNNILAIEYCKAILSQNSKIKPSPIFRGGNYHDMAADPENPSASSIRSLIENGKSWNSYMPSLAADCFASAAVHTQNIGERAILYRLRTMTDAEFEALPYGSEGLWRKLMKNARQYASVEEILTATKSKRYTRTRLDRMVMCAFLGLTAEHIHSPAPYVRVLALNDKGREILLNHPYQEIEHRCDALYGLFAESTAEPKNDYRVYYHI